ncbi:MAG: AraC family transcriptional regulator [Myxococcota bacterium]
MPTRPAHVDLWPDRALIIAPLGTISRHRHAAAALLIGLNGPFRLMAPGLPWRTARAAFVPAGASHALECDVGLIGVLYLFPFTGAVAALRAAWGLPDRIATGVPLPDAVRDVLRDTYAGIHSRTWVRQWIDDSLLGAPAAYPDPRLVRAAALVRHAAVEGIGAEAIARAVGWSASRLMHRFQAEGVTLRRVHQWERMRLLTAHVAAGDNLTMAALGAGFADSAHLSNCFRGMFGTTPSRILNRHSRLRVGDGFSAVRCAPSRAAPATAQE